MTDTTTPAVMQGLAAYLRCEAGSVPVCNTSHAVLLQWAQEVEAAIAPVVEAPVPAAEALLAAACKVMDEFGTSSDGLQDLLQALKAYAAPQPIAQTVQPAPKPQPSNGQTEVTGRQCIVSPRQHLKNAQRDGWP